MSEPCPSCFGFGTPTVRHLGGAFCEACDGTGRRPEPIECCECGEPIDPDEVHYLDQTDGWHDPAHRACYIAAFKASEKDLDAEELRRWTEEAAGYDLVPCPKKGLREMFPESPKREVA